MTTKIVDRTDGIAFCDEAIECLEEIYGELNSEKNEVSFEVLDKLYRILHNLKGTARMVQLRCIESFIHKAEDFVFEQRAHLHAGSSSSRMRVCLLDFVHDLLSIIEEKKIFLEKTFDEHDIPTTLAALAVHSLVNAEVDLEPSQYRQPGKAHVISVQLSVIPPEICWEDHFNLGIRPLDDAHRKLFLQIKTVFQKVHELELNPSVSARISVALALAEYNGLLRDHNADEISLIHASLGGNSHIKVPKGLRVHEEHHHRNYLFLDELCQDILKNQIILSPNLIKCIWRKFVSHITVDDLPLVAFLRVMNIDS